MPESDGPQVFKQFNGTAPIFPLPNAALFPNVMLPLHVFEPRYRSMVSDVLKSDGCIAIASLKNEWQSSYLHKDCPIHETVCLGTIVADQTLEDGRYCLLIQGVCRAVVLSELTTELPYRIGQLKLEQDIYPDQPVIDRQHRQQELVTYFREVIREVNLDAALMHALKSDVPLGELCDVIAHLMRLPTDQAQQLLQQVDVDQRSDLVLEFLKLQHRKSRQVGSQNYPLPFSLN